MKPLKKKRPLIEDPKRGRSGMWDIPAQYAPGHEDWCSKDPKRIKHLGYMAWCVGCKRRIS